MYSSHLEDTNQRLLVAVAEAELAAVRASIDRLIADRGRAEAVLAQARLTSERLIAAAAAGAAGAEEVDKSREAVAIAEAELARAAAALIEGHRRARRDRRVRWNTSELAFQDMSVLAPFDGPVVRRDRDAGDVVTAGSVVLQLASTDRDVDHGVGGRDRASTPRRRPSSAGGVSLRAGR